MTKEALTLALEALEESKTNNDTMEFHDRKNKAITAIKKDLAQPEQEPVAWESLLGAVARGWCYEKNANKTMDSDLAVAIAKEVQALYTTPPQRTWVGLSDDDINDLVYSHDDFDGLWDFADAVEAKLKEKNT